MQHVKSEIGSTKHRMNEINIKMFEPLFGKWYIEELIGSGSFGCVYKAYHEDLGERMYSAIKFCRIPQDENEAIRLRSDGMNDKSISSYFQNTAKSILENEVRLMNMLKGNTNIVSCEDVEIRQYPDGMGYCVFIRMELLSSIASETAKKEMSLTDIVKLGLDMCNALELCEKRGIIHRDIKPDNIFINDNGDYKLGDFGVARQLEKSSTFMSRRGNQAYMAPEVYKGERYGEKADIYSLGLVLYRLLNNSRMPFMPQNDKRRYDDSEKAFARRMSGERFPLPENAENSVGRVVLMACEYAPERRFSSAKAMRMALALAAKEEKLLPLSEEQNDGIESVQLLEEAEMVHWIPSQQATAFECRHKGESASIPSESLVADNNQSTAKSKVTPQMNFKLAGKEIPDREKSKKAGKALKFIAAGLSVVLFLLVGCAAFVLLDEGSIINKPDKPTSADVNETVSATAGSNESTPSVTATPQPTENLSQAAASYETFEPETIAPAFVTIASADEHNAYGFDVGYSHAVAIRSNGTVVAKGDKSDGKCDVEGWKEIVAVAAGWDFTVGVRRDGRVVFTGKDYSAEGYPIDLTSWHDVVDVSATGYAVMGLDTYGYVYVSGGCGESSALYDGYDASDWSNIVQISAGYDHMLGLRDDGTVEATGSNSDGQLNVGGWRDVVQVAAGAQCSFGLTKDGKILFAGCDEYDQSVCTRWTEITGISAMGWGVIGIKENGDVLAAGYNSHGQADVHDWKNVLAAAGSGWNAMALTTDGRLLIAGRNQNNLFDITKVKNVVRIGE